MSTERNNASKTTRANEPWDPNAPDVRIGVAATPFTCLLAVVQRVLNTRLLFHTWISYPNEIWGERWLVNADAHGVRVLPQSAVPLLGNPHVEYRCRFNIIEAMSRCRDFVGRPYDYLSLLVGHPVKLLTYYLTGVEALNPVRDASRFTCSEFVATVFKAAELPGTENMDPESETPASLVRYMDGHPELFERMTAA